MKAFQKPIETCPIHLDYALPCLYCRKVSEDIARWKKGVSWIKTFYVSNGEEKFKVNPEKKRDRRGEATKHNEAQLCWKVLGVSKDGRRTYRCRIWKNHPGNCRRE